MKDTSVFTWSTARASAAPRRLLRARGAGPGGYRAALAGLQRPQVPAVAARGLHRPEPRLPGSGALFSRSTVGLVPLAPPPSVGSAAPRARSAALAGPCWARRFWLARSILGRVQGPCAAFPILQYQRSLKGNHPHPPRSLFQYRSGLCRPVPEQIRSRRHSNIHAGVRKQHSERIAPGITMCGQSVKCGNVSLGVLVARLRVTSPD